MTKSSPVSATNKVRARKMWANLDDDFPYDNLQYKKEGRYFDAVFVLPATPEAYDAMVEQGARDLCYRSAIEAGESERYARHAALNLWKNCTDDARATLASIGITNPARPTDK